ncbi:MAG: ATP synthase F1 subunit delta [Gemmatimonadetes bacterium]|nr:ATP synthase F1 subunit delta [Gemmatimonadota bacterium]
MSGTAVSRNYAAALFELAGRDGSEALYGELIQAIGAAYEESESLRHFLGAPSVGLDKKKRMVSSALGEDAPELFVRFLKVMLDRRRQGTLPGVASDYRDLLDKQAGRVRADVTLPFEADDAVRGQVLDALERRFEKKVIPEFHVDPKILGGVIIRIGDELMDASVRRQLEQLRHELV